MASEGLKIVRKGRKIDNPMIFEPIIMNIEHDYRMNVIPLQSQSDYHG